LPQVGCQGLTYIRRQGHPIMKHPLAPYEDFAGSPVDVLELESNYLTGTETETGKQEKHGIIATADRRVTVASFEHSFDFLRSHILRHGGQPPIRHRRYTRGQVGLQLSLLEQVPEEGAESSGHDLRCSDTHGAAAPQNKNLKYQRLLFL